MADTDCCTRILTRRELTLSGYALIEKHGICHELVVIGSLGVFQDIRELLKVRGAQVERHVAICLLGQELQALGLDLQNLAAVTLYDLYIILRQKAVLRLILLDRERLLIDEICHIFLVLLSFIIMSH